MGRKLKRGQNWVYFIHKRGQGVARIPSSDPKCLSLYRRDSAWREVKQAAYRDERFKLCLV